MKFPNLYITFWRWHFWSGLVITPVFIIATLSGALYIFKTEIEQQLYPDIFVVNANQHVALAAAPLESLRKQIRTTLPGYELDFVNISKDHRQAWEGIARPMELNGEKPTLYAYFDPYENRITGVLDPHEGLFGTLLEIHRSILAGMFGRILVELATCWGVISVLTGLYLWWPRRKELFWGVWLPRFKGNSRKLLRDWHTVPAFYIAPFAILILITGLLFSPIWGITYRASTAVTGGFPAYFIEQPTSSAAGSVQINADEALSIANQEFEFAGTNHSIQLARPGSDSTYHVMSVVESPLEAIGVLFIDQFSGEVVISETAADLPIRTRATLLFYPIHVGSIFGMPTKFIALLTCIVLIVSVCLALWMWWRRRVPGSWGAPKKQPPEKIARWFVRTTVLLGVLFPVVGASLLLLAFIDWSKAKLFKPTPQN
ncbi:MAG: PepSY domain-containing protein [Pseudomonadota bacterium]